MSKDWWLKVVIGPEMRFSFALAKGQYHKYKIRFEILVRGDYRAFKTKLCRCGGCFCHRCV